ncbi:hypothetical protein DRY87_25075 [Salmonella enterica subsp. enterica serovar Newport]|nr:hypothetical protein [Salmonella enterica subsp. enterica serovar Newport]
MPATAHQLDACAEPALRHSYAVEREGTFWGGGAIRADQRQIVMAVKACGVETRPFGARNRTLGTVALEVPELRRTC